MRDSSMKRARVLLSLLATYLVLGDSAVKADDPRAMQLTYGPWTKLCFKRADGNSDCFISAAARGACTPSGGGVSISIRDKKLLSLLVNFGTTRTLEGGISVQIDQDVPIPISHPRMFWARLPWQTRHRRRLHRPPEAVANDRHRGDRCSPSKTHPFLFPCRFRSGL
jgi:hypothetical protein